MVMIRKAFLLTAMFACLTGCVSALQEKQNDLTYYKNFEDLETIPPTWQVQGKIYIDKRGPFKGKQSLTFERTMETVETPTSLVMDSFPVKPGFWDVKFVRKADLYSPDSSFNGTVYFDVLDANGKVIDKHEVRVISGKKPWKEFRQRYEIPEEAATGRFRIKMNKTWGKFTIDNLYAAFQCPAPKTLFKAVKIKPKTYSGMFYPGEKIIFDITAECSEEWKDDNTEAVVTITDYWGAEQLDPIKVKLEKGQTNKKFFPYQGVMNLDDKKFEQGKFYRVNVEVAEGKNQPYKEQSSFAILPKPITKSYRPHEIPFTLNNWDDRIKDTFFMADRVGIRWKLIWSGWSAEPPYEPYAPGIEWIKELDMGALLGCRPVSSIEKHQGDYKKYDEKALKQGAKNMINKYKNYVPIMIRCGNEPHHNPESVKECIPAYKAVYEGVKEADPNIFFIGTSCNPSDEHFKQGYWKYTDAYDFHTYSGWKQIRNIFKEYKQVEEKYNAPAKPIFCTEIGLNSQGMARIDVAKDMIRKFACFFAEGGANLAWFDLLYPDTSGKIQGSNGESFNVFNTKYCLYSPKITAVSYYNLVNGICIKKFIEEKIYSGETEAILFRDKNNKCLLITWKEKGRHDAFIPLKGVGKVKMIRIDGSSAELDAAGKGLTLSFSEEPLLLFFDSADLKLADKLEKPEVSLQGQLPDIVTGGEALLTFDINGINAQELSISTPPKWQVKTLKTEKKTVTFAVTAPKNTLAKEGRLTLNLKNSNGEIYLPLKVLGKISLRVVPEPYRDGKAGLKIVIRNNSPNSEEVSYVITIPSENVMDKGTFEKAAAVPFEAKITGDTAGKMLIDGNSEKKIILSVSNFDPKNLYTTKVTVTDSTGTTVEKERFISGFVGVPKVKAPLSMDIKKDESEWNRAQPLTINEAKQMYLLGGAPWKGTDDLSGVLRFLWDDQYLYLRMDVKDDKYVHAKKNSSLWAMDGLQMLVDPSREIDEKGGYYDMSLGDGTKGPQAWCHSSADSAVLAGEIKNMIVKVTPTSDKDGSRTYEVAIPWSRLLPFNPAPGNNLGIAVIMNEDDGPGRKSFMGWFGCAHSKQLDLVGDLILQK